MPDMSIKDYIMAALLAAILGLCIYVEVLDTRLTLKTAEYDTFVANTKAAGAVQEAKNKDTELRLSKAAVTIQEDLNATLTSYNKLYDDYNRMRHASTSGSKASNLSEAASKLSCPSGTEKLAGGLEQLEAGILEKFIKPLGICLAKTASCKTYLDNLSIILPTE